MPETADSTVAGMRLLAVVDAIAALLEKCSTPA